MFQLTGHAATLFVLLLLLTVSGASCPRRIQSPESLSPIAFAAAPTLEQIAATVNANTARVGSLQSRGATLSISGMPALRADVALERPTRFRLVASTGITGTELDLGSNDQLFWMWAKRNDPPAIYYATHQDFAANGQAARSVLPLPPTWLIEALGLVVIDSGAHWSGPFPRDAGRVEIRGQFQTHGGSLTKVIVIDDRRGYVVEQHVVDATGQLLAVAMSSQHEFDAVNQVTLPRRIDIQLPPAGLAFTLAVDAYQINVPAGESTSLWSMPQVGNTPLVPLVPPVASSPAVGFRTGDDFIGAATSSSIAR